jgi:hypothetical protein
MPASYMKDIGLPAHQLYLLCCIFLRTLNYSKAFTAAAKLTGKNFYFN